MSSRSRLPSADPARRRAAEGARSWRFLALYALANAGGVAAFLPLLTLLLPLKVQAVAGDERLVTLTLCARSEEHTSELQSLMRISYAVFCLKKKKKQQTDRKRGRKQERTKPKRTRR